MTIHRLLRTRLLTPKKETLRPQDDNSSTTTVLDRRTTSPFSTKGTTRPRDDKKINYYCTRRNDSRQPMTSFIKKATSQTGRQIKEKKSTIHWNFKSTQADWHPHKKPRGYYNNCSSLWRWLQAADNLISDGFHLRNIFRELLLRTASTNPIANKGQVHGREKGLK